MVKEGKITEKISIQEKSKALYQGEEEISFVIYNYLGVELDTFIKKNKNLDLFFIIFRQLFDQIYALLRHYNIPIHIGRFTSNPTICKE